ncbi:MAG: hypothetical protein ABIJ09_15320 [Pseudomonadota bacterium]
MHRTLLRCATLFAGLALLQGCPEPPNQLEGSVDENFDLGFDEVRIRTFESTGELQIEYLRKTEDGSAKDVVAQITVTRPSGGFPANTDIKFEQVNGKIHRVATGDDFPAVKEGTIVFFNGGNKVDEQTSGEFNVLFENKRTLRGRFDAKLTLATAG